MMKLIGIRQTMLVVALAIGVLFTAVTVASADHSWNGYHWPSYHLDPSVVDKTSSSLYDVPAGVLEWSDLGTDIQPALLDGRKGDITVSEGFSWNWLGLARIYIEGEHITKAEIKLNTRLLNSYGVDAADHVLCQEIGHVLGLDHNRDGPEGGTPDDTCMNDVGHLGEYTTPNSHDVEQLNLIYDGHTDPAPDDGDGGGGPPCSKNPNHPNCRPASGNWITVHVFPAP